MRILSFLLHMALFQMRAGGGSNTINAPVYPLLFYHLKHSNSHITPNSGLEDLNGVVCLENCLLVNYGIFF